MCGIAGIVDTGAGIGQAGLRAMAAVMAGRLSHRGPDDAGAWADEACGLAHRRLAIIDLRPDGRQPMGNEDGSVQVTFNGEIYNYQTLRTELEQQGHFFRTSTDTEVLPHLFEDLAPAKLDRLDGMFGLAIWQADQRRLLLARDPFGKKPLYYAEGPGWLAFASELHALLAVPGLDLEPDRDALGHFLLQGYVPAPLTICKGVRKLCPGSYLLLEVSGAAPVQTLGRFFRFQPRQPGLLSRWRSEEQRVEELRQVLVRAVAKRLAADVPLGAFLSGGVDSSLVAAIATQELGVPLRTFSIGFVGGGSETEHPFARAVADQLGTDHHEELLRPNAFDLVQEIAERLDEPNGDSSCLPTYLLCRFARSQVTVALSGDGGDEVFGGYPRYQIAARQCGDWPARLRNSWHERRWFTPADSYLSAMWLTRPLADVAGLLGGVPDGLLRQWRAWRSSLNDWRRPLIHRLRAIDAEFYLPGAVLPKVDRMSMQVALEVRCPLLDREVAACAAGLSDSECLHPSGGAKHLLKRVAERYLPADWLRRPKMGFGVPTVHWSLAGLWDMARDLLGSADSPLAGLLDRPALRNLLARESRPGQGAIYQVWPLLILELWLRKMRRDAFPDYLDRLDSSVDSHPFEEPAHVSAGRSGIACRAAGPAGGRCRPGHQEEG